MRLGCCGASKTRTKYLSFAPRFPDSSTNNVFTHAIIHLMKYFLYAHKSTDVEDKQVLSIEAQLAELKALAKREQLNVVEVFIEKKSAKCLWV